MTARGAWTSTPQSGVAAAACSGLNYVVTPTGPTTATVNYSATCVGRAVTGSGSANLNGSTLEWTATGMSPSCTLSLSGTAIEVPTGLSVLYSGQVCGLPVTGTDVLHR